jgi:hypothetical protein
MPRRRGNSAQEEALDKLLSALVDRKFEDVRKRYRTVLTPTWLIINIGLPGFPIIRIGKRGGFDMPDISRYPQVRDASDSLEYPGKTAFDACLFGDEHVKKQGNGAATDSPLNNLPWESDS